ncbi:hypothetical protein [Rhodococcus sp. Q]|uniref:hypothetical protein n=1 Tax=Rhodococcus sp. Q TaxID=2502252 RepID=UPI0010F50558|nr:hypothetical protein [Rhodococcus sp. Q]
MSRTVPCPHTGSSHDEHKEDSPEYLACREEERRRVLQLRDIHLRILAGETADVPPTRATRSALTPQQQLAALMNRPAPKDKSDGFSFGG